MRRPWLAGLLVFVAVTASGAHTPLVLDPSVGINTTRHGGDEGVVARWDLSAYPDGAIPYWVNPACSGDVEPPASTEDLIAAVRRAFQVWEDVPDCAVRFRYMGVTERRDAFDGVNVVTFDPVDPPMPEYWAGIWPVAWYAEAAGELAAGDGRTLRASFAGQVLDCDLVVSWRPGYLLNCKSPPPHGAVDVEGVLVHEIGHLLGLDHSGICQTTMYAYATQAGGYYQKWLSADDAIGVSCLYPEAGFLDAHARIRGVVTRADGSPLLGAHVVAISADTGTVAASTISGLTATRDDGMACAYGRSSGAFLLVVPPGRYRLLVEPYGRDDQGPPWLGGVFGTASAGKHLLDTAFEPCLTESLGEAQPGQILEVAKMVVPPDLGLGPGLDRRPNWILDAGKWAAPARAHGGETRTILVREGRSLLRAPEGPEADAERGSDLALVEGAVVRFLSDAIQVTSVGVRSDRRELLVRLRVATDCPTGYHVLEITTPTGATYFPGVLRILEDPEHP